MNGLADDDHKEIRAAVRDLCAAFPNEYWAALEPDRYPREFVDVMTEQGWLAALIPADYGGAGLDLRAATAILEEVNASGGNAGACHAQMYTMGTLLRHGSDEQKQAVPPADRGRQAPAAGLRRHRAERRLGHDEIERPPRAAPTATSSRAEDLDVAGARVRPHAPAGADDAARGRRSGRRALGLPPRPARGRATSDDRADPDDDEPRHDRGLLRRRRGPGRRARRRGGEGLLATSSTG